jgi:transposase
VVETIVERPAALDVHKAQVTACVRVPNERGEREEQIAGFPTTVGGLLGLGDWLAAHRVQQMVIEATWVYRKAPWAILEDEFGCLLVNARAMSSRSRVARPMCPTRRGFAGLPRRGC